MTPVARMDRRRVPRGDVRREALLRALAAQLQEVSRLDEVSITDVAKAAGVSRSAFYFYFENKALAVAALMGQVYGEAEDATATLLGRDGTPRQRIETALRDLVSSIERHRHLYRAMHDARAGDETVRAMWDADRESFVEPVTQMILVEREAAGVVSPVDAKALAQLLLELNDRALERVALGRFTTTDLEALVHVWLGAIVGAPAQDGRADG